MKMLKLLIYFLYEFVKANYTVAKIVLGPNTRIKPAIICVPVNLSSEFQIFLLANMITLTPGTLSLSYDSEHQELFVHVIHTDDPTATVKEIKSGFEQLIREAFA